MFLERKTHIDKLMEFNSFERIITQKPSKNLTKIFIISIVVFIIIMLLPWTQNIQSEGSLSTISPNQRPQQINSIIAGRIEKWYIQDGQVVQKGDTLLEISEVKEEYLDPNLLGRVTEQIKAKSEAIEFYDQKANTASLQQDALNSALRFKLEQVENKLKQYTLQVQSDSIAYVAAINLLSISTEQLSRRKQLYAADLNSLTELETRQQYYQDALAKKISAENKYYNGKNELLNIKLELLGTQQDYTEKISKIEGDKFTALSQVSSTEGEVAKLNNTYANYQKRQAFYIITAPQAGQVLRSSKAGIGETVKEGEVLITIVPKIFNPAVEIYISPLDMPLISNGQKVQLQFDGYPAIIFSGWPQASYGIFSGRVAAIDQSIHSNGKFRVWVKPDPKERPWPKEIKFGAGAKSIALLSDVTLIYELWRQLNGFPPEFYKPQAGSDKDKNTKDEK
jgi:adhesin transport system membrane fusion protein